MFVGHLAVALVAKPAAPNVSLGVLIAAVFGLDLLWPLFLLAGIERVAVDPGATSFTPLDFVSYPWSHSLVMAVFWGAVLSLAVRRRGSRTAWVVGAAVVSHWLLDVVAHRPDLPLWPGGPEAGLGLWNSVAATFAVEGGLLAAATLLYSRHTAARSRAGRWALWSLLGLTALIWASGPFAPPPPNATSVAVVALAMWLFPFWGHWIERTRTPRHGRSPAP